MKKCGRTGLNKPIPQINHNGVDYKIGADPAEEQPVEKAEAVDPFNDAAEVLPWQSGFVENFAANPHYGQIDIKKFRDLLVKKKF